MTSDLMTARVSHKMTAAPERVFDAWLDPDKIRAWMSATLRDLGLPGDVRRVEVDARVGGTFTFSDIRPEGEAVHWGTYLVLERPHQIVFTWFTSADEERKNRSTVTLTIEPDGPGCVATITHEIDAAYAEYRDRIEGGWSRMLKFTDAQLV